MCVATIKSYLNAFSGLPAIRGVIALELLLSGTDVVYAQSHFIYSAC